MNHRTLICTFGFAERKVLAAMRKTGYSHLVLVAGKDVLDRKEFRLILGLEAKGGGKVATVTVDPFDFRDCYESVDTAIRGNSKHGEVVLSISGGTKVLSDAAILAAFQNGVEAFHIDDEVVKLPVLRGVRFEDAFNETDVRVLRALKDGDTSDDLIAKLSDSGTSDAAVRKSLKSLERIGVLEPRLEEGRAKYCVIAGHRQLDVIAGR